MRAKCCLSNFPPDLNNEQRASKSKQAETAYSLCTWLSVLLLFHVFVLCFSLSLFFSCLLLLSPLFSNYFSVFTALPASYSLWHYWQHSVTAANSLSGVRDSLHATDLEEIGFWMPQPQFIWLFNSFLLNQNTKTFPVFYLMLKIW